MENEAEPTGTPRGAWLIALAVLLPVGVFQAWWTRFDLGLLLDHLTNDDTFLYLQVVRNIAEQGRCSFDGIHVTTGIQPLWTALLVPLAGAIEDRVEFLRFVLLLSVALNLVAGLLIARIAVALSGHRVAALLVAVLWAGYMLAGRPALLGMECGLIALTFSALLLFLTLRPPAARPTWGWRLGLAALTAAVFLSRTDSVLILAVIGVLVLVSIRRAAGAWGPVPREGGVLAGLTLLLVAPYLVFNLVVSGRLMPVSGAVKMWYAAQDVAGGSPLAAVAIRETGARAMAVVNGGIDLVLPIGGLVDLEVNRFGLFVGVAIVLAAVLALTGAARRLFLALLAAGTLHVIAFAALLGRFSGSDWYYVPEYVGVVLLLAVLLARAAGGRRRASALLGVAMLGLLLAQAGLAHRRVTTPRPHGLFRTRYELAQKLNATLPPDAILASWNAGQLGYFTDRPVVNLDGLVNDAEYFEHLRSGGDVREYLRREGIGYIADYNRRDASMSRSHRWNARESFRGIWPLEDLTVLIRHERFVVFAVPEPAGR